MLCSKENEELERRCENLFNELQQAKKINREEEDDYQKKTQENKYLKDYIEKTGLAMDLCNTGKTVSEVKERQKRRKIKELKSGVEKALWFAGTYGLNLTSATFSDVNGNDFPLSFTDNTKAKSYKNLSEEEKNRIKEVLFIQDKFCVGEAAYHELTMSEGGESLPRSYLIRQCKDSMNELCHIERTPGMAEGAQVNFKDELKKVLTSLISNRKEDENNESQSKIGKIKVKLSGDGAKMTRVTSFVILSFSILDDKDSVMSSKGNHTVAVIKGAESYELLETSCSDIFQDVNKLIKEKYIKIDGCDDPIEIEICMGGDYKFLLLIMGLKGATSDFACLWCKIFKALRYDMSKPMDFYITDKEMIRTLEDIKKCALKNSYSCEHVPLVNIPLENIVLDELHLMLRVTDKLTKNLILEAVNRDNKDSVEKTRSKNTMTYLDSLVKTICSCGISFSVWEKKNADGKASGVYDFTSLMGSEKKILLEKLPEKLSGVITPETSDSVIQLWKDFNNIYSHLLQMKSPTEDEIEKYFSEVKAWVDLFVKLGSQLEGYGKARVTTYIHAMAYHVPQFMRKHGGVKKFTGQGN
ncbi:uncharacterized protein LOC110249299 [Exaiptasia diaphana]|uniref:Uncharacterized protein n=1 Tax=Exaiptasia diaphana TaxID=2652724 RepID=A0A913XZ47_EXADI|nr:uncharacterized protein LOC110249299 [Exaiptasia diaphana]